MDALDAIPIETLIPHRSPMILIDRLLEHSSNGAVCETVIRWDHIFNESEGVPAHIGMELMAQTLAAMNGYQSRMAGRSPDVGFLLGTSKFQTQITHFKIGQCLRIAVTLVWGDDELRQFQCEIEDQDRRQLLQSATINAFVPKDLKRYLEKEQPS